MSGGGTQDIGGGNGRRWRCMNQGDPLEILRFVDIFTADFILQNLARVKWSLMRIYQKKERRKLNLIGWQTSGSFR